MNFLSAQALQVTRCSLLAWDEWILSVALCGLGHHFYCAQCFLSEASADVTQHASSSLRSLGCGRNCGFATGLSKGYWRMAPGFARIILGRGAHIQIPDPPPCQQHRLDRRIASFCSEALPPCSMWLPWIATKLLVRSSRNCPQLLAKGLLQACHLLDVI